MIFVCFNCVVANLGGGRGKLYVEPLLKQAVPESYVRLQDAVRDLAQKCMREKRPPIYTTADFRSDLQVPVLYPICHFVPFMSLRYDNCNIKFGMRY